jgi:hypothetical protein
VTVDSRLLLRLREDGDGVGDLAVTSSASLPGELVRHTEQATPRGRGDAAGLLGLGRDLSTQAENAVRSTEPMASRRPRRMGELRDRYTGIERAVRGC